jgi:hypothetical protein
MKKKTEIKNKKKKIFHPHPRLPHVLPLILIETTIPFSSSQQLQDQLAKISS